MREETITLEWKKKKKQMARMLLLRGERFFELERFKRRRKRG